MTRSIQKYLIIEGWDLNDEGVCKFKKQLLR